jgi:ABC-type transport system involved in multi-copper enzyme maturation permease subunit
MIPTRAHYFFASSILMSCWLCAWPTIFVVWVTISIPTSFASFFDVRFLFFYICSIVIAVPLGLFAAVLSGFFILGPILYDRGLKNGGPFIPGDLVRVLTGDYKDTIARVYQRWQHDSVRVDLGEDAKLNYKDVFGPYQLLRTDTDEQNDAFKPDLRGFPDG